MVEKTRCAATRSDVRARRRADGQSGPRSHSHSRVRPHLLLVLLHLPSPSHAGGIATMSHLYPHLRIHQVFGANTDVGKTLCTTALCLASSVLPPPSSSSHEDDVQAALAGGSSSRGEKVHYLKPVSTGPMTDSDDG